MEREQKISLGMRIAEHTPLILDEMKDLNLAGGARILHFRTVIPEYFRPGSIEKVLDNLGSHNGSPVLTSQQVITLLLYRDFRREIRTPRDIKTVEKIAKTVSREALGR